MIFTAPASTAGRFYLARWLPSFNVFAATFVIHAVGYWKMSIAKRHLHTAYALSGSLTFGKRMVKFPWQHSNHCHPRSALQFAGAHGLNAQK